MVSMIFLFLLLFFFLTNSHSNQRSFQHYGSQVGEVINFSAQNISRNCRLTGGFSSSQGPTCISRQQTDPLSPNKKQSRWTARALPPTEVSRLSKLDLATLPCWQLPLSEACLSFSLLLLCLLFTTPPIVSQQHADSWWHGKTADLSLIKGICNTNK